MGTVKAELDTIQTRLHDNGVLWTRAELLRWWQDGYRDLLARSQAVTTFIAFDLPPRVARSYTYLWETWQSTPPHWHAFLIIADGTKACTSSWEAELIEGVTPTASYVGITQPWERAILSQDVDRHLTFALPLNHEAIKRITWDNKILTPISVRELDALEDAWMRTEAEPFLWTLGVGRVKEFEIYEVQTTYIQNYELQGWESGIPRNISGSRIYATQANSLSAVNSYGYTSSGDSQALTNIDNDFAPRVAYTTEADQSFAEVIAPKRLAFFLSLKDQDGAATTRLGMFAHERFEPGSAAGDAPNVSGNAGWETTTPLSDAPPSIGGMGWRFTQPARTNAQSAEGSLGFCTQVWEVQQLQAQTVTAGANVGTYAWEAEFISIAPVQFGVGTIRSVSSPDRQYLAQLTSKPSPSTLGTIRAWGSSDDALLVTQVVIPDLTVAEADSPDLLPVQLLKYLRYFVWARAFGRIGEGQQLDIAAHYLQRFERGVALMRRLADSAHEDRMFQREQTTPSARGRVPRVQFPSKFERVW